MIYSNYLNILPFSLLGFRPQEKGWGSLVFSWDGVLRLSELHGEAAKNLTCVKLSQSPRGLID